MRIRNGAAGFCVTAAIAAMAAAGCQHAAAVRGSHSLTETVLVDAFAAGGLECSFHDIYLLYFSRFFETGCKDKIFS